MELADLEIICKCISNKRILDFVAQNLQESYCANYPEHKKEVAHMMESTFSLLSKIQTKHLDSQNLLPIIKKISKETFQAENPDFWFNTNYKKYKYRKTEKDWQRVGKYLIGKRVLDLGSGYGYLSLELQKKGYEVISVDILDYRIPEARTLKFIKADSYDLSLPSSSIDTAILKSVLHHIDDKNIPALLGKLWKITKRILLCENVYDVPSSCILEKSGEQPILLKFSSFNSSEQLQCLILTDFFTNAITTGNIEMNYPCSFKTITEWEHLFEKHHFSHSDTIFVGFDPGKMTRNCQVWMVFDAQ